MNCVRSAASVDLARTLEHFAEAFAERAKAIAAELDPPRACTTSEQHRDDGGEHWVAMPAPNGGPPLRLCGQSNPRHPRRRHRPRGWQYPEPLRLLLDLVGPGTTFLDLGAHLGTVSLCVARQGALVSRSRPRRERRVAHRERARQQGRHHRGPVRGRREEEAASTLGNGTFGAITDDEGASRWTAPGAGHPRTVGTERADVVKMDVEGHELAVLDGMADLLAGTDVPAMVIEETASLWRAPGSSPATLRRLQDFGLQTWRIGDRELFRVGPDDLQPETVCDYLASRAEPPWPQRPAPDADSVAARFVAEGRHALWTHRRYVAGVLAGAPPEVIARPEIQELLERLLIDPVRAVHTAASWWLASTGEPRLPCARARWRARSRRARTRRVHSGLLGTTRPANQPFHAATTSVAETYDSPRADVCRHFGSH